MAGERDEGRDAPVEGRFSRASPEISFRGFTRCATDPEGNYRIRTLKPGPTRWHGGGVQAPHIAVSVFARGLLQWLVTRIYFADEEAMNAADPVLAQLGSRAAGLLAEPVTAGYRFDIRLQGTGETPFFSV